MLQEKIHPRRPWIRRHPIITTIIAIPIVLVVLFFGAAVVAGLVRAVHIDSAHTLQEYAASETWYGHNVELTDTNRAITIKETLGSYFFYASNQAKIMTDCDDLQSAFWEHYPQMQSLDVEMYLPQTNTGDTDTLSFAGNCVMKHANGVRQQWGKMSDTQAWDVYDEKYINPAIAN